MVKRWIYRISLNLFFLESAVAAWILQQRLQQGGTLQPVLAALNQAIVLILVLFCLACLLLLGSDFRQDTFYLQFKSLLEKPRWRWGLVVFFSLILIETAQDLLMLRSHLPADHFPIYLRESEVLFFWAALVSLEAIALILLLTEREEIEDKAPRKRRWIMPGILLLVGLAVIFLTGAGYVPDSAKIADEVGIFTNPNAPLILPQILILWGGISLFGLGLQWAGKQWKWTQVFSGDLGALVLLWLAAFLIWSRVPLDANYFLEARRPPNFQYNVASDSIYYETQAHRFLVGEGFSEDVQHPFYAFLLSGFHLLGGEHYQDIYLLQVALLALTPFAFYKLAGLLSNKYAGWLAGGLLIVREYNALLIADSITLSTVNLLMTETTSVLGAILALYLMAVWFQSDQGNNGLLLLTGGLIGLLSLLRVELLSLLVVFCGLLLVQSWKKWGLFLSRAALVIAAALLLTAPWMTRNYLKTGEFSLDKGKFVQRTVRGYLSRILEEEDSVELTQSGLPEDSPVSLGLLEKIGRHTKNNLVVSFLYLPSNHQFLAGVDNYIKIVPEKNRVLIEEKGYFSDEYLTAYVKSLPYWWNDWDGSFSPHSILPVTLVMGIIGMGFWYLWEKDRLLAVLPILVLVTHSFIYALFSRSGSRFIQAVDWVPLLYFCLGLGRASRYLASKTGRSIPIYLQDPIADQTRYSSRGSRRTALIGFGLCFLIGISMPLSEGFLSPRYTRDSLEGRWEEIVRDSGSGVLLEGGSPAKMVYGKAIYPAFYKADRSVLDDRSGRVPPPGEDRLVFYLVGMENIWVSFPTAEPPACIPHGSEIILEGYFTQDPGQSLDQDQKTYLLASRLIILKEGNRIAVLDGE